MLPPPDTIRQRILALHEESEESAVAGLLPLAELTPAQKERMEATGREWIASIREGFEKLPSLDKLIHRFRLTDTEGLAMMALAEALPRIPDDATADLLIADKLSQGDWRSYLESYPDFISKLAWLGLTLGKDISTAERDRSWLSDMKAGALRETLRAAMKRLGGHFVLGETIEQAVARSLKKTHALERYSFDMLGEAARTAADARRYFDAYRRAIAVVGSSPGSGNAVHGPSISVKLSALHPRYEWAQAERVEMELLPLLADLVETAAQHNVGLTIDAEEAERLELSLTLIEKILALPALKGYEGFGMAIQAYQKRAPGVIAWLQHHAQSHNLRVTARLVKGAYWDREIKQAQERGLSSYHVYTRKPATDIAYLGCARLLFDSCANIMPQFGTHNLATALALKEMAGEARDYEVQRLHGMGAELHARMMDAGVASCVYAPVGPHDELLSYLVRRLVENSANSSFVNQLYDRDTPADALLEDPADTWRLPGAAARPAIPLPAALYGNERMNSQGHDLSLPPVRAQIAAALKAGRAINWQAAPVINGARTREDVPRAIKNPAYYMHIAGQCFDATHDDVDRAITQLHAASAAWTEQSAESRAGLLERLANRLEDARDELLTLLVYEAGKTVPDALNEIREAVDSCRYYAAAAVRLGGTPATLPGVSGEENILTLRGRGVFACISPWNFPLAIMLAQTAAALVTGNCVAIKPAEQTPLIAAHAVKLMLECGFPPSVLALLPGNGAVGAALVSHPLVAGVVFTGSTATAQSINRALAARDAPIAPLIAETGGLNALIADASALPEQIVDDAVTSAFRSAGQRCSAARLLCVQDSLADRVIAMLAGAINELVVGLPQDFATDVGPVIDEDARAALEAHESRLKQEGRRIAAAHLTDAMRFGHFVVPQAWEIPDVSWLTRETFGPILHVVRYRSGDLEGLIDRLNAHGYALTGGFHSRIDSSVALVKKRLRAGNLYINRSIIGAVVGSQPFGGEGLSGTGPKAGGPHYLHRFISERTVTTNLTATGGDIRLLTL